MHRKTSYLFLSVFAGVFIISGMYTFASKSYVEDGVVVKSESKEETPSPPSLLERIIPVRKMPGYLLPDLVPLPPRDLSIIETEGGTKLLLFSTTYFNQGDGPLELRPDEATAGMRIDIDRDIFQRIYHEDGNYQDKFVGNFLWHQEHLHYHYADFIEYDLEAVDAPKREDLSGTRVKSTFCIRDVSRVDLELAHRTSEALYLICGKELQGVSVGWGDTYFSDYPDQNLNVTGLAPGTYRLTFNVNPERILEESRYDNNISSTLMYIDVEHNVVEILDESPSNSPLVEHIHLDEPFGGIEK